MLFALFFFSYKHHSDIFENNISRFFAIKIHYYLSLQIHLLPIQVFPIWIKQKSVTLLCYSLHLEKIPKINSKATLTLQLECNQIIHLYVHFQIIQSIIFLCTFLLIFQNHMLNYQTSHLQKKVMLSLFSSDSMESHY